MRLPSEWCSAPSTPRRSLALFAHHAVGYDTSPRVNPLRRRHLHRVSISTDQHNAHPSSILDIATLNYVSALPRNYTRSHRRAMNLAGVVAFLIVYCVVLYGGFVEGAAAEWWTNMAWSIASLAVAVRCITRID